MHMQPQSQVSVGCASPSATRGHWSGFCVAPQTRSGGSIPVTVAFSHIGKTTKNKQSGQGNFKVSVHHSGLRMWWNSRCCSKNRNMLLTKGRRTNMDTLKIWGNACYYCCARKGVAIAIAKECWLPQTFTRDLVASQSQRQWWGQLVRCRDAVFQILSEKTLTLPPILNSGLLVFSCLLYTSPSPRDA